VPDPRMSGTKAWKEETKTLRAELFETAKRFWGGTKIGISGAEGQRIALQADGGWRNYGGIPKKWRSCIRCLVDLSKPPQERQAERLAASMRDCLKSILG